MPLKTTAVFKRKQRFNGPVCLLLLFDFCFFFFVFLFCFVVVVVFSTTDDILEIELLFQWWNFKIENAAPNKYLSP